MKKIVWRSHGFGKPEVGRGMELSGDAGRRIQSICGEQYFSKRMVLHAISLCSTNPVSTYKKKDGMSTRAA